MPVAQSLRGILLRFASAEYLTTINLGVRLVLFCIVAQVATTVIVILVSIEVAVTPQRGGTPHAFHLSAAGFSMAISLVHSLGYWKFTKPDPGYVGTETPASARKFVRVAVAVLAFLNLAFFGIQIIEPFAGSGTGWLILNDVATVVSLGALGVWGVQFFAVMRYVHWLAGRVPDNQMRARTSTYMWLLPVLAIVGIVLVGLGPLIALVLYWNMLDKLRKHIRAAIGSNMADAPPTSPG
jgi:hypothetical protein